MVCFACDFKDYLHSFFSVQTSFWSFLQYSAKSGKQKPALVTIFKYFLNNVCSQIETSLTLLQMYANIPLEPMEASN